MNDKFLEFLGVLVISGTLLILLLSILTSTNPYDDLNQDIDLKNNNYNEIGIGLEIGNKY